MRRVTSKRTGMSTSRRRRTYFNKRNILPPDEKLPDRSEDRLASSRVFQAALLLLVNLQSPVGIDLVIAPGMLDVMINPAQVLFVAKDLHGVGDRGHRKVLGHDF